MVLPSPGFTPPMTLPALGDWMSMPRVFGTGSRPVGSVPMKFPITVFVAASVREDDSDAISGNDVSRAGRGAADQVVVRRVVREDPDRGSEADGSRGVGPDVVALDRVVVRARPEKQRRVGKHDVARPGRRPADQVVVRGRGHGDAITGKRAGGQRGRSRGVQPDVVALDHVGSTQCEVDRRAAARTCRRRSRCDRRDRCRPRGCSTRRREPG